MIRFAPEGIAHSELRTRWKLTQTCEKLAHLVCSCHEQTLLALEDSENNRHTNISKVLLF